MFSFRGRGLGEFAGLTYGTLSFAFISSEVQGPRG